MSRRRTAWAVYGASLVLHAGLGTWMATVDPPPPPPPPPITIVMAEPETKVEPPPKPPEPEPEPEPDVEPEPAPEAEPEPEPDVEPPPPPPRPRPAPAPSSPPPAVPAPPAPDFGVKMSGGVGPGGLAMPEGDPAGKPGGTGKDAEPKKIVKKARALEPKPAKAEAKSGCAEPDTKPRPESMPQPEYAAAARAAGVQGKVRVRVTVGADGKPSKVEVVQSLHPELDEAAKKAVLDARFAPATRCGEPVSATFTIAVRFSA